MLGPHMVRAITQAFPSCTVDAFGGPSRSKGLDLSSEEGIETSISTLKDLVASGSTPLVAVVYLAVLASGAVSPESDPEGANAMSSVNVHAPLAIAKALKPELDDAQGVFVYTSSDMVFGGDAAPYAVDASPAPLTHYGASKAEAEDVLLSGGDDLPALFVPRLPLLYGKGGFFAGMLATARSVVEGGEEDVGAMTLFTDEFRTPCDVACVAEGIAAGIVANMRGLHNLGGPARVSRWDMGVELASALGMDEEARDKAFRPALVADVISTPRPRDLALDSAATWETLGLQPRSLHDGIQSILNEA